jgi:hypothetical protein
VAPRRARPRTLAAAARLTVSRALVRGLLYPGGVRPLARLSALVLGLGLAFAPAGCVLHLGDDDEPLPCKPVPEGTAGAPAGTQAVNPETLRCEETFVPCNDTCGVCDDPDGSSTWAPCQSQCTGLGVAECGLTPGCRQAWDELCLLSDAICPLPDGGFYGCFAVDLTGPVQGECRGLAAQDCSRHDDCLATYRRDERCSDRQDDDFDGVIDEPDECLTFGTCLSD